MELDRHFFQQAMFGYSRVVIVLRKTVLFCKYTNNYWCFGRPKPDSGPVFFLPLYLMAHKILMGDKGPWVKNRWSWKKHIPLLNRPTVLGVSLFQNNPPRMVCQPKIGSHFGTTNSNCLAPWDHLSQILGWDKFDPWMYHVLMIALGNFWPSWWLGILESSQWTPLTHNVSLQVMSCSGGLLLMPEHTSTKFKTEATEQITHLAEPFPSFPSFRSRFILIILRASIDKYP